MCLDCNSAIYCIHSTHLCQPFPLFDQCQQTNIVTVESDNICWTTIVCSSQRVQTVYVYCVSNERLHCSAVNIDGVRRCTKVMPLNHNNEHTIRRFVISAERIWLADISRANDKNVYILFVYCPFTNCLRRCFIAVNVCV